MRDMDNAFNVLSDRPKIKYELPQLPEPNSIDPKEIVFAEKEAETKEDISFIKPKKKARSKKKSNTSSLQSAPLSKITKPKKVKPKRKTTSRKKSDEPKGKLVPIIKRTRRVKKVKA